jgi:protein subunit release factor B
LRGPLFYLCFTHRIHQTASLQAAEKDVTAARKWLAELRETSLPSNIGEVSYSRSSGPGGQNVNKSVFLLPFHLLILIVTQG